MWRSLVQIFSENLPNLRDFKEFRILTSEFFLLTIDALNISYCFVKAEAKVVGEVDAASRNCDCHGAWLCWFSHEKSLKAL